MPDMDGLEVLAELEPKDIPLVIFVTAYDDYALDAFDLHALDYLVKPFSDRRFMESLARAKEQIRRRETEAAQRRLVQLLQSRLEQSEGPDTMRPAPPAGAATQGRRLALREGGRVRLFRAEDVIWIEAVGSYVRLHMKDGSKLVRATLRALEEQLEPHQFFRIHRSAIVAIDQVQETRHDSHGDYLVVLRNGTELKLTRARRSAFELQLGL
jgi:two-component system LytT family response regulator